MNNERWIYFEVSGNLANFQVEKKQATLQSNSFFRKQCKTHAEVKPVALKLVACNCGKWLTGLCIYRSYLILAQTVHILFVFLTFSIPMCLQLAFDACSDVLEFKTFDLLSSLRYNATRRLSPRKCAIK